MFKSTNVVRNLAISTKQFKNLVEFNLLKEKVDETGQPSKTLDSENKELETVSRNLDGSNYFLLI